VNDRRTSPGAGVGPSTGERGEPTPLRIAYVVPAYPPLPSQPFVVNEMVEVQEAGHALVVVPLYPGPPSQLRHGTFASLQPTLVLPVALCDLRTLALALWVTLTHPVRAIGTLMALHRAAGLNPYAQARVLAVTPKALAAAWRLRRAQVDHIHAHFANQTADCAAIAGAVSGIPFSFTAHAYDIYSTALRMRNTTLGWKVRRAARVMAVSDFAAALLRAYLPPTAAERVHTVRVGIPLELFRTEPPPPPGGPLRLLCVARFFEKKGLDTLIDACAVLRERGVEFELRLYGDGPLRPVLAARITQLGLGRHVLLGEAIVQEEVARAMKACHVFVMPCRQDRTGDMDGIPTVFMEAMATGRPVVSCDISGIPELVRDGDTGLLVPPDDPPALAAAIARLAADHGLRQRLGERGRALVERQHDRRLNTRHLLEIIASASMPRNHAAGDASGRRGLARPPHAS
jgi:colanic acid/amylovoran biosynthesis glycosyltransferase